MSIYIYRERNIRPQLFLYLFGWQGLMLQHVRHVAVEVMTPSPAQRAARPCKSLQVEPG